MGDRRTLGKNELYAPREAGFVTLVDRQDAIIKLSAIHAKGLSELDPATVDAARAVIETAELASGGGFAESAQLGAGFAVLHIGEQGVWLLLHLWMPGGIASRHLWRSDIDKSDFEPAPDHLMACVWELAVVDFERRAWMETALAGRPVSDYFARTLPAGPV
jgi:hypothetical protein